MKNSADLGGCYPPRPSASVDNTLLNLQNSSYPTQPHSIIAKYYTYLTKNSKDVCLSESYVMALDIISRTILLYVPNAWLTFL